MCVYTNISTSHIQLKKCTQWESKKQKESDWKATRNRGCVIAWAREMSEKRTRTSERESGWTATATTTTMTATTNEKSKSVSKRQNENKKASPYTNHQFTNGNNICTRIAIRSVCVHWANSDKQILCFGPENILQHNAYKSCECVDNSIMIIPVFETEWKGKGNRAKGRERVSEQSRDGMREREKISPKIRPNRINRW